MELIDKSEIVAEIERRKQKLLDHIICERDKEFACRTAHQLNRIIDFVDTLEVKEIVDLQGIEKEVADNWISRLDSKRIPITLKGKLKEKFINEFNTLWQTVGKLQFANVAKAIIERMCLHFAAWGSYNLRDYIKINAEESSKLDTLETKEVDLEKEIKDYFDSQPIITRSKGVDYRLIPTGVDIAKHFFELRFKAKGE